jgi:type VI secretion system secreted protein Hcp
MFPTNWLRRLGRHHVATKDESSRARRVRTRRNPVGLEPLEERQLLAFNTYMLIPGVTGSATAASVPKGAFPLASFAWGASHPEAVGATGFSAKLSAPNFSITKLFDSATIGLLKELAAGTVNLTGAEVLVFKSGTTPVEVLEYDFTNLVVTSAQLSNSSGDATPTESDAFAFTKVRVTEWTVSPTGGQGTPTTVTINFATGTVGAAGGVGAPGGLGAPGGVANIADGHVGARVHGLHKAKTAGLNHRLASHKHHVTQLAKTHRISAIAQSLVHGK